MSSIYVFSARLAGLFRHCRLCIKQKLQVKSIRGVVILKMNASPVEVPGLRYTSLKVGNKCAP
jgi:hypothetical protein